MKNIIYIIVLSVFSLKVNAAAYSTCGSNIQKWRTDYATLHLNSHTMPIGGVWDLKTREIINQWNNDGSKFEFRIAQDTDTTYNKTNGKTEIIIAKLSGSDGAFLGATYKRSVCFTGWVNVWGIVEADIVMNSNYPWTSAPYEGEADAYSFGLVMNHELGHALGLNHISIGLEPNTMYPNYPNGGPVGHYNQATPLADDRLGLRILYPKNSTVTDVAVSRYKKGTAFNNSVLNMSDQKVSSLLTGFPYKIEYTALNLGTQEENVTINFYISSNSYISHSDTYIGKETFNLRESDVKNGSHEFTVPTNLASRNYFIGYSINVDGDNTNNDFVSLADQVNINTL